mmetsp:Transcript_38775/g.63079  ORF Transcript_38775/g.63079 Transcript_38775/m.63079 type:complete len:111 (+) Transcript_38775:425-757(+)
MGGPRAFQLPCQGIPVFPHALHAFVEIVGWRPALSLALLSRPRVSNKVDSGVLMPWGEGGGPFGAAPRRRPPPSWEPHRHREVRRQEVADLSDIGCMAVQQKVPRDGRLK